MPHEMFATIVSFEREIIAEPPTLSTAVTTALCDGLVRRRCATVIASCYGVESNVIEVVVHYLRQCIREV